MSKTKEDPKAKPEEPKKVKVLLAFVRSVELEGGKKAVRYLLLPKDWETNPPRYPANIHDEDPRFRCFKKFASHGRPGMVFEVDATTEDAESVYSGSATYAGHLPETVCAEWTILNNAIEDNWKRASLLKKQGSRDVSWEALEPWRAAYKKARTNWERSIIVSRLTVYVTRGIAE